MRVFACFARTQDNKMAKQTTTATPSDIETIKALIVSLKFWWHDPNFCIDYGHTFAEVHAPYRGDEENSLRAVTLVCKTCTELFHVLFIHCKEIFDNEKYSMVYTFLSVEKLQKFFAENGYGTLPEYIANFSLGPGMPPRERWVYPSCMDDMMGFSRNMSEYGCMLCHATPKEAGGKITSGRHHLSKIWSFASMITEPDLCDTVEELKQAAYLNIDDSDRFRVCLHCTRSYRLRLVDREEQTAVVVAFQSLKPKWKQAVRKLQQ